MQVAKEMFTGKTFFARDARFRGSREQKRANQCEVIRSDQFARVSKSSPRKRSEAERGDIAERDERGDARDHVRLDKKRRVTLVRHFENVDIEAAFAHRIERRGGENVGIRAADDHQRHALE